MRSLGTFAFEFRAKRTADCIPLGAFVYENAVMYEIRIINA